MYAALKYISILFLISFVLSCTKEEIDPTPPGTVSVTEVKALNGGAQISYSLPNDDDILYVRAEYTNSLGEDVFKVSSRYGNTIEVDGFNDTLSHEVNLYVVDVNENKSEAVPVTVTPLISYIYLVQESVAVNSDLGGVNVTWENVSEKMVFVYLYIEDGNKEDLRILASDRLNNTKVIRGLDSVYYDFSVVVEDFSGNMTNKEFVTAEKPLFEEKINKASWTLVSELSVDGNAWEGLTENFWDDIVDTKENPNDNSYFIISRDDNGGFLNYPLDIVIDLNKNIKISRFTVWQRAYWYSDAFPDGVSEDYYYYQEENMKEFELWVSNDLQEWKLLGDFDIGDPKDEDGNIPPEYIQEAIDGHEFDLPEVSEEFRYLKFSITASYGSETNVYGSEITLFGIDNLPLK